MIISFPNLLGFPASRFISGLGIMGSFPFFSGVHHSLLSGWGVFPKDYMLDFFGLLSNYHLGLSSLLASSGSGIMGDHFVLMVDRLLTESTLEAAIEGSIQSYKPQDLSSETESEVSPVNWNSLERSPVGKLVECRICQDEDEDCNLETPCSCCGSLKYAHRRCVQRWCNEKGDTVCEICLQQFKPGYTAPPQLFHYGGIPMNFRGNWEITRRDRLITMVATDRSYDDEYSASTARSLFYCRSVVFIFMILLVLRHTLPIIISENQSYSFMVLAMVILRIAGIVVPIYVMMRALLLFQHRRRRQYETRDRESPIAMSEIEV